MAAETFDTFFPTACAQHGASYIEARDTILSLEAKEKAQALAKLKVLAADPSDWQKQITAEIISGWVTHKPDFVKCRIYARGDLPGRPPLPGFTSHHRAHAIAGLGQPVAPRVIEMVWKTSEYQNDDESDALFGALELLDDKRAVMPMVSVVQRRETIRTETSAINVLGQIGDVRGLDVVLDRAHDTYVDNAIRLAAIRALGGFDDQRALDALTGFIQESGHADDERLAAAWGLRDGANPDARQAVINGIETTENEKLQIALILVLADIGKREDIQVLRKVAVTGSRDIKDHASDAIESIQMRDRSP